MRLLRNRRKMLLLTLSCTLLMALTSLLSAYGRNKPGYLYIKLSGNSGYSRAKISINGRHRGYVNRQNYKRFNIAIPRQQIQQRARIRIHSGSDSITRTVVVTMGRRKRLQLTLKKKERTQRYGWLRVHFRSESTVRSANLYINDQYKGTYRPGRTKTMRMKAGRYIVELRKGKLIKSGKVTVRGGKTVGIYLTLKRKARYGTIRVRLNRDSSVRRAAIYINGAAKGAIRTGQTRTFRMKKGVYNILVRSGQTSRSSKVMLGGGKNEEVYVTLKRRVRRGRIRISLSDRSRAPYARVYINDRYRGRVNRGDRRTFSVKAGRAEIQLRWGGKKLSRTVQIHSGRTVSREFNFRRRRASLKIRLAYDSEVSTARLYIDGRYRRTIRKGRDYRFRLRRGSHTIKLRNNDLQETRTITLSRGERKTVKISLKEERGRLLLRIRNNSLGYRSRVYIDGNYKGRIRKGRSRRYTLKAGSHRLTLRAGGKRLNKTFTIQANRTTFLTYRFPKPDTGKLMITHSRRSRYSRGRIYINGRYQRTLRRGRSMTIVKKAGSYRISMRYRRKRVQKNVTVVAGDTGDITLSFRRRGRRYGYLIVEYPDESRYESVKLYVNNRYYGTLWQGDRKRIRTRSGRKKVQIKASGRTRTRFVTIRSRRTATVSIGFKRTSRMGRIRVYHSRSSKAASARLYINGKLKGRLRRGKGSNFKVRPGQHRVVLRANGRKAVRRVVVKPGRRRWVSMRIGRALMAPEKGTLIISLKGSFRWAKVYVNKRYRGRVYRNKVLKLSLPSGIRYTVKVSRDDMQSSASRRVYLRTDSTRTVPFNLIFSE